LRKVSSTALRASQQREAAETVTTVNARYGYKPERSRLRGQAGAAIASKRRGKQDRAFIGQDTTSAISRPTILL